MLVGSIHRYLCRFFSRFLFFLRLKSLIFIYIETKERTVVPPFVLSIRNFFNILQLCLYDGVSLFPCSMYDSSTIIAMLFSVQQQRKTKKKRCFLLSSKKHTFSPQITNNTKRCFCFSPFSLFLSESSSRSVRISILFNFMLFLHISHIFMFTWECRSGRSARARFFYILFFFVHNFLVVAVAVSVVVVVAQSSTLYFHVVFRFFFYFYCSLYMLLYVSFPLLIIFFRLRSSLVRFIFFSLCIRYFLVES